VLACQESASGFAVDAASQAGHDGFAVLGENERLAFLELANLSGAQDRNIVAGKGAAGHCPGLPGPSGGPDLPDQVEDLLVERSIFGAAEQHQDVSQSEEGAGLLLAEDRGQWRRARSAPLLQHTLEDSTARRAVHEDQQDLLQPAGY
jgi:hypothetical protein